MSSYNPLPDPTNDMDYFKNLIVGLSMLVCIVLALNMSQKIERIDRLQDQVAAQQDSIQLLNTKVAFKEWERRTMERQLRSRAMWVSRAILSETRDTLEQRYVAWVIRHRYEQGFRGADSYREVVLDPFQFSAFNYSSPVRSFYMNLNEENSPDRVAFKQAYKIALDVITAPGHERPFPRSVTHFYSPVSMPGHQAPHWAHRLKPAPVETVNDFRFRFYHHVN